MSSDEKSKLLCELTAIHLRDEKRNEELMAKIDELIEGNRQMSDLKDMLAESEKEEKEVRLYRQGKEYRTMTADKSICHECDITKLPKDAIIRRYFRYLNTFWIQLFAYTHDGSYTIDNSITERFIRPLAGERKNSLFFGSGKMASVSAAYHTIISTCKMQGIPVLQYLKEFFKQIVLGRTDYENLLPMTIGLINNKY